MTREQQSDFAMAILAHLDGRPVQVRAANMDNWTDTAPGEPSFSSALLWRPKPESKTRPWSKSEDVPMPVCWIRHSRRHEARWLVVGVDADSIAVSQTTTKTWLQLRDYEYSTDGKHFQKCEVTE